MKIELIEDGSYRRKLQVLVPAQDVKSELDKAFGQLKRKARIQGFRPGKVPRRILEMRFGAQVAEDVAGELIQRGYADALSEHSLDPVSRPTVEEQSDVAKNEEFSFTIAVEVRPDVTIESYTGMDVVYPKYEVTDEEVDSQIRAKLEGQSKLTEVTERPIQSGDMVLVELVGRDGDDVVFEEPGTMIRTEADPYYPGVDAMLVGLSIDEEKTETVSFSETARTESVQGKELSVTAKVISIQANEVPELTDELAKELGHEEGAEAMKVALQSELEKGRAELSRNQARANLLQVLIEANHFDVPPGMVDQQLEMLIQELKLQQSYRGIDPRTVRFNEAQIADLRMRSEFAVKGGLILDFVGKTETIEVTDEALEEKYQELADERGQTIEAIKGYFVKDDAIEDLKARLLEEKTLDWLLDHANHVEPPVVEESDASSDEVSNDEQVDASDEASSEE